MSSTDFYRAFEDRYRGSRELIRQRLEAYRPFIEPFQGIYKPTNAVDLGCGRGEWIELLLGAGFAPQGVDLDAGMLSACTARGLPVIQGDAIAHLQLLGDGSQCIISGFHIAEHIAFDDLQTLVIHALRVLKPGGLLILETPNPENVVVGTSSFYLDPTHQRPIPPLLLSFLAEHHGFTRVRTLRLQESAEIHTRSDIRMMDVLGGVSPDYAVVAQKAASPEVMARFDAAFATHYGIELQELADRYDDTMDRRMGVMEHRLANAEAQASGITDALARIGTLQDRLIDVSAQFARTQADCTQLHGELARVAKCAAEAEAMVQDQQKRIDELNGNAHHWWQQACALEAERNALRQSASWRITAPLRFAAGLVTHPLRTLRSGANVIIHRAICTTERPLSRLMAAVLRRPQLSHRINSWLLRYPALYQQLIGVARRGGVVPGAPVYSPPAGQVDLLASPDLACFTPRARQIYTDLQAAIKNNKGTS